MGTFVGIMFDHLIRSQTRRNGAMHVLGVIDHQLPLQPVMIFLYAFGRFAFDHKSRSLCAVLFILETLFFRLVQVFV